MKKTLFVLLILLVEALSQSSISAQPKVIVGDTDQVKEIWIKSEVGDCPVAGINFSGTLDSNGNHVLGQNKFYWVSPPHGFIRFPATQVGTFCETADYELFYADPFDKGCWPSQFRFNVCAEAISDSLVLIRPREWTALLKFDSASRIWKGRSSPLLKNNVKDSTLFEILSFDLSADTSARVDVTDSTGAGSSTITLLNFTQARPFTFNFASSAGTSNEKNFSAIVRIHVKNRSTDSIYTQFITLLLEPPAFKDNTALNKANIQFEGVAGQILEEKVKLAYDPQQVRIQLPRSISYPFSISWDSTSGESTITCSASTAGDYSTVITIPYELSDILGTLHYGSVSLSVSASISMGSEPVFWRRIAPADNSSRLVADGHDNVFAFGFGKQLLRYDRAIETWRRLQPTPWTFNTGFEENIVQTDYKLISWSSDAGETWSIIPTSNIVLNSGAPFLNGFVQIFAAKMYSRDSVTVRCLGMVMTGSNSSKYVGFETMTSDGGLTWVNEFSQFEPDNYTENFYRDSSGGFFFKGRTWGLEPFNHSLVFVDRSLFPKGDAVEVTFDGKGNRYVVTNAHGVYISSDLGKSWQGLNAGIASSRLYSITFSSYGKLYVLGDSGAVYESIPSLIPIGADVPTESRARAVSLYPNPATSVVHIDGISGDEKLDIFDQLGRSWFSGSQPSTEIDVRGIPNGAYVVRVSEQVIPMIVWH